MWLKEDVALIYACLRPREVAPVFPVSLGRARALLLEQRVTGWLRIEALWVDGEMDAGV